jgi:glutamine synthetase
VGGQELLDSLCNTFHERHKIHIENYGSFNELRLTGEHETQSINEFSVGVGDRGASIRIPVEFKKSLMGYLEDRRPSSNVDPYRATRVITEAIEIAEKDHTLVIV